MKCIVSFFCLHNFCDIPVLYLRFFALFCIRQLASIIFIIDHCHFPRQSSFPSTPMQIIKIKILWSHSHFGIQWKQIPSISHGQFHSFNFLEMIRHTGTSIFLYTSFDIDFRYAAYYTDMGVLFTTKIDKLCLLVYPYFTTNVGHFY